MIEQSKARKTIRLTMAQALVKFLDNQYISFDNTEYKFVKGVFAIFGHGNVGGMGEALENLDHDLEFCQGHNEQGMANTAIAYAKQKNRLGIWACTSSIGPGALNMVTAAGTATTNRLPILLLPGDIFACRQPDPVLQQLEQPYDYTLSVNDCFKPVSKYWDRIQRSEQLMTACINAMRVLTDPVDTGAVTLCLPQDVQTESYDYPVEFFDKRVHEVVLPEVSEHNLALLTQAVKNSERPLIIAGGGVKYSNSFKELDSFVNKFNIPVVETQAGKSSLSWDNTNNMGAIGVLGSKAGNTLAKEADLVLALGTRLSDFTTCSKSVFNKNTKIYNININKLDSYKLNSTSIISDIKSLLNKLSRSLEDSNYKVSNHYREHYLGLRESWQAELTNIVSKEYSDSLSQTRVLAELNSFVDDKDIVVGAAGSLPGDLQRVWQVKDANTYHLEYAFSCMGYEVAGALGAKLAEPGSEVYAVVGDGSFLMLHSEILTSLQEAIKVNIILFDNSGYQCIYNLQKSGGSKGFGNQFRYKDEKTKKLDGENIPIDFAQYASGLGVQCYKAHTINSFKECLAKAKKSTISTLIEVKVDPSSMSGGYDSWWRFDVAEESNCQDVVSARKELEKKLEDVR